MKLLKQIKVIKALLTRGYILNVFVFPIYFYASITFM